jgi:stage II sporulation protein R
MAPVRVIKILLLLLLIGLMLPPAGMEGQGEQVADSPLRLHIRANSNSPADQALKYSVRDALLEAYTLRFAKVLGVDEAEKLVAEALPEIVALAEETVRTLGSDYSVSAVLSEADFPTRLYGNHIYRAGKYHALQIYLGDGQGDNWWCVLFPPLCFVEVCEETAVAVYVEPHSPPRPRSRLLEWWQRFIGRWA